MEMITLWIVSLHKGGDYIGGDSFFVGRDEPRRLGMCL